MRIFISSTFKDLEGHREALAEVLARMKLQVRAMEFFGSRTDEPLPASTREIDDSDIVAGIYAWRYGWQPSKDRRSITEEEFLYAREKRKPILCYIVDPTYPWPPAFIDKGKAADRLQRFKTVVETLVRSKFTTPDNLAKQVAADLARELVPQTHPVASAASFV